MAESSGSASSAQPPVELEPIAELTALAQLLQQGRQARGVALAELAQRLHMGLEQLEALEQADRTRLPEPVFVIAQARRIAAALDLDAADQIEALRVCPGFKRPSHGFNPDLFNAKALQSPPPAAGRAGSRPVGQLRNQGTAVRFLWVLPVGLVLLAAGWGVWSQRAQLASLVSTSSKLPPAPTPSPAPAPAKPARQPATAKAVTAKAATAKAVTVKPGAAQPVLAPESSNLIVQAKTTSWLEVTSLNGQQKLFRGMFKGEKRFPLGQGVRLLAGRPDIVRVSTGAAPAKPLGTVKDIRWFQFKAGTGQPLAAAQRPQKQPIAPTPR